MSVDIGSYRMRVGLFSYYQSRSKGIKPLSHFELVCWLSILLIVSGDIHENPGPASSFSSSISSVASEVLGANLKIVHYNVQSFYGKKDILYADLHNFDILAFTETWLTHNIDSAD